MRNDCKFRDYSALYVTCFKIDMTKRISDHQSDSLLPTHWKTISLNSGKTLLISHHKWNIWSLCRENHSIACSSSSGHLGVKRPIFARLADILSLPERIVAWSRLQHRTMDSLIIHNLKRFPSCFPSTFIPKVIVYEEWRAFGMMRKITVTKEILDWNVSQVKVTESIVVFLQLRSSIYIFTDSLFFLLSLFSFISFCIHWAISQFFPVRFAYSNGRLQSRISLSA